MIHISAFHLASTHIPCSKFLGNWWFILPHSEMTFVRIRYFCHSVRTIIVLRIISMISKYFIKHESANNNRFLIHSQFHYISNFIHLFVSLKEQKLKTTVGFDDFPFSLQQPENELNVKIYGWIENEMRMNFKPTKINAIVWNCITNCFRNNWSKVMKKWFKSLNWNFQYLCLCQLVEVSLFQLFFSTENCFPPMFTFDLTCVTLCVRRPVCVCVSVYWCDDFIICCMLTHSLWLTENWFFFLTFSRSSIRCRCTFRKAWAIFIREYSVDDTLRFEILYMRLYGQWCSNDALQRIRLYKRLDRWKSISVWKVTLNE